MQTSLATYRRIHPTHFRGSRGGVLKGCLIALAIFVVLAIILSCAGGIWLYFNWRWAVGSSVGEVAKQAVNESNLPADQKQRINVQIDRVTTAFIDESLTMEKAEQLVNRIANSPIVPYVISEAVKANYVQKSNLSDEQQKMVIDQTQRFMRGVIDDQISQPEIDKVMNIVSTKNAQGDVQIKETLTEQELLDFAEAAKNAADEAGVAEEVEEVDLAAEIEKAVDEVLGGGGNQP